MRVEYNLDRQIVPLKDLKDGDTFTIPDVKNQLYLISGDHVIGLQQLCVWNRFNCVNAGGWKYCVKVNAKVVVTPYEES